MNGQRPSSEVAHFKDLPIMYSGRNKAGRHVNHQPEASEAAAPLEPAADVTGQTDAFPRDPMDRFARLEQVWNVEWTDFSDSTVVHVFRKVDDRRAALHQSDLIAQMKINGSGADLIRIQWIDDDSPGRDLPQNDVMRQYHGFQSRASSCSTRAAYRSARQLIEAELFFLQNLDAVQHLMGVSKRLRQQHAKETSAMTSAAAVNQWCGRNPAYSSVLVQWRVAD